MSKQIVIGGLYTQCTPPFFRGILPGVCRCIKANIFDAGVLLLVRKDEEDE